MPIDPLLRAWGHTPPAIIRDMRATARDIGIPTLLQDAVSALDTRNDLDCRIALCAALALLGEQARAQTPTPIRVTPERQRLITSVETAIEAIRTGDCNRLQLHPVDTLESSQTPEHAQVNSTVDI